MNATMRAVVIAGGKGPASALHVTEVPRPTAGPGQLLIRVAAAGVNRPDLVQREGHYPPPPGAPDILGLEVAGQVVAAGPGATRWQVGDVVTALLGGETFPAASKAVREPSRAKAHCTSSAAKRAASTIGGCESDRARTFARQFSAARSAAVVGR